MLSVMSPPPFDPYSPPSHRYSAVYTDDFPLSLPDHHHQHHIHLREHHIQMQPQQPPPSPSIPIDPSLALYPPYYSYSQPQQHQLQQQQHLALPPNYSSSPSSQDSDAISTPPMDSMSYVSNPNGKRPGPMGAGPESRKKPRKDSEDPQSPATEKEEAPKAKPTRGSRACTVCRRLKMKCVGAEQGPPCKRCQAGNHECIFEESNRGKRSSNTRKHELLTRSLRKMERTLDTVLRSIGNPSIASGMISRSPSPSPSSNQAAGTQALLASQSSPSPPQSQISASNRQPLSSPKLHSLPDNALNPLGLLAEASLANRRAQGKHDSGLVIRSTDANVINKVGVASDNYFKPGPMTILPLRRLFIERQIQPEMLSFVDTDDVVALFNIYFDHLNMHCNLLDRDFHTPSLVCSRSPFLLTTICAISSKFYTAKPDLHPRLTELAKKLAFNSPAQGYKSVEIVQAYLLLSLWGCGAVERYEQDKTWMLLGMGIRMAIDLNLHRKTAVTSHEGQEGKARDVEVHNRERTWLLCFCLDRSFSAQMGKPHSIKEDIIIRNATKWMRSPCAMPTDTSLALYVELQRILSRSLDVLYSSITSASGLQTDIDYILVIKTMENQINAWLQTCCDLAQQRDRELAPEVSEYKMFIVQFYYNYAMLVLNSFGLQNALDHSTVDLAYFFSRCHSSAITCANLVRNELGPRGFLKYSPDSHFVQTSYAVLSLLKFVRPEFQAFMENEQNTLALVKSVADVLESVAANPSHTPALYGGFLKALISARLETPANGGVNMSTDGTGSSTIPPKDLGDGHQSSFGRGNGASLNDANSLLDEFRFNSEMGPVADMSTFPPTMMVGAVDEDMGYLSMDSILSTGFWDSVLVPGYSNTLDGLSGGFVFGAGGSGLITPRQGSTPLQSGSNTPARSSGTTSAELMHHVINSAFSNDSEDVNGVKHNDS